MIVKESINFERGLDPKQAMNVGLEQKIANFLRERMGGIRLCVQTKDSDM